MYKRRKACPPEDIGGVGGYYHFLEILEDKKNPEREELMEWYGIEEGDEFDENYFDLEDTNVFLSELFESEFWNMTADEFMSQLKKYFMKNSSIIYLILVLLLFFL